MAVPSYARPTSSSTLKASPRQSKIERPADSECALKKRKRPSTLTAEDRQTIAYRADLYPIKPLDPSKPCPLSELPSELRTDIYSYVLQHREWRYKQTLYWPSLLHICRAIRIEAAYTYFTSTPFKFEVVNLNFSGVRRWVETLAPPHRTLLAINKQLTIKVDPSIRNSYTYPPKDYILDTTLEDHWKACQEFGNLYTVTGDNHRRHFIFFCRLASWYLWCARPVYTKIVWNYVFPEKYITRRANAYVLKEGISSIASPCVQKAWTRNKQKDKMAKEALSIFTALESAIKKYHTFEHSGVYRMQREHKLMGSVREFWENSK